MYDSSPLPNAHSSTSAAALLHPPQAIGLLDDLDKELNTYAMRVREWYGWHFPEMTKIVADNIAYAKAVSHVTHVRRHALFSLCARVAYTQQMQQAHVHSSSLSADCLLQILLDAQ
jgi:RNA processing factor Prp31